MGVCAWGRDYFSFLSFPTLDLRVKGLLADESARWIYGRKINYYFLKTPPFSVLFRFYTSFILLLASEQKISCRPDFFPYICTKFRRLCPVVCPDTPVSER